MELLMMRDNVKIALRKALQAKMILNDRLCLAFAMLGQFLAVLASELYFWSDPAKGKDWYQETIIISLIRTVVTLTTIVTVVFIIRHYRMTLQFLKAKEIARPTERLSSTGLVKYMVIEIVVCSIHSPPFVNAIFYIPNARDLVPYSLDIILTLFPLMRFYLLWRVFVRGSFWQDENAVRICREVCNTHGGPVFAIKCEMKERPYTVILFALVIIIFIFGFGIRAAELPYQMQQDKGHDWRYLWNGMWCIIITMTCVGYGDLYPTTHIGRVIAGSAAFIGNLLIAVMVVSLTFTSEFSPQQRKAYELVNQDVGLYNLHKKAIFLIQQALRYRVYMKKTLKPSVRNQNKLLNKYRKAAHDFSKHRKSMNSMEQEIPQESLLVRLNQQMTSEFDKILVDSRGINRTLTKLNQTDRNQAEIEDLMEKTLEVGNRLMAKIELYKSRIQNEKARSPTKKKSGRQVTIK